MSLFFRVTAAGAVAAWLLVAATGCGDDRRAAPAGTVAVVVTTPVLADLTRAVGGRAAAVTQLLRPNADPHEYEPRPHDVLRTARAAVVLVSGDGLDRWMADVVAQSGSRARPVDLSRELPQRLPGAEQGAEASRYDPHWWHDPRNTEAAVEEIRTALTRAAPASRVTFAANAAAYLRRVRRLDAGIARCVAALPPSRRKLVTDHDAFGYFVRRYAITQIGAVIPSQTTQGETSAGEVARLVALIRRERVTAVFPETSVNARLAQAIARETGADARRSLYGDTLGPPGSPGATYLGMERANADAMVRGFTGGARGCAIPGL
jgi:zinc/manganese transport system substrate-binding protein